MDFAGRSSDFRLTIVAIVTGCLPKPSRLSGMTPENTRYRGGTVPDLHRIPFCFHRLRWNQRTQTNRAACAASNVPAGLAGC